jgi:hypothetical protein
MTSGETEDNIEWIVANKKIFNWHILYILVPLLSVVSFLFNYFILSDYIIFNLGLFLSLTIIFCSIFTVILFIATSFLFPYEIGFSNMKIFLKSRIGKANSHEMYRINYIEKKGGKSINIIWKFSKYPHRINVDPEVRDKIIVTFKKYKNQSRQ